MADNWPTKRQTVASLHLDSKNPRLGRETVARAPREIIQYLFDHDKAVDVAQSIATRGGSRRGATRIPRALDSIPRELHLPGVSSVLFGLFSLTRIRSSRS